MSQMREPIFVGFHTLMWIYQLLIIILEQFIDYSKKGDDDSEEVSDLPGVFEHPYYIIQIVLTVLAWMMIMVLFCTYTLRIHATPAFWGAFIFGVIFLAVPQMFFWEPWKKITCLVVNMILNCWSWYLIMRFGLGNLDRIETLGNYRVGHKSIFSTKHGNPISVWYPIDNKAYPSHQNKMYMEGRALENLQAIMTGAAYTAKTKDAGGPFMFKHILHIKTNAVTDAPLASDFASGENKMIPILFSHGYLANREDYQMMAMELASNGYIVFVNNSKCGLGRYVENQDGSVQIFNVDHPHPDDAFPKDGPIIEKGARAWYDLLEYRISEWKEFVVDMEAEGFMANTCGFSTALLDMEKLVMSGHSLGGATAMAVGEKEDKVKMILALDPFGTIFQETIGDYTNIHDKYLHVQNTEQLYNVEPRNLKIHGPAIFDKMKDPNKFENIVIEKTDHMHQGDLAAIMPLELKFILDQKYAEQGAWDPQKRYLMTYFTALWIRFMRKHGFCWEKGLNWPKQQAMIDYFCNSTTGRIVQNKDWKPLP